MSRALVAAIASIAVAAASASPAQATWSIVAVDPETQEVGAAIASCVDLPASYYGDDGVLKNLVVVPGVGAGVTQATVNLDAADRLRASLLAGSAARDAIDDVTATGFDADAAERQHAVVRLDDPAAAAAFTGSRTLDWSGHRTALGASAQGNILASERVVAETLVAFRRLDGEALDRRLVGSLLAGSAAGGDTRCDGEQTALFAQVAVAVPGGKLGVRTVRVDQGDGRNPVELLAAGEATGSPRGLQAGDLLVPGVVVAVLLVLGVATGMVLRRRSRPREHT